MSALPAPLEQFRNIVFAQPALQQELRRASDRATFIRLVAERARQHGLRLDQAVIEAALDDASRAWLLRRWIEP